MTGGAVIVARMGSSRLPGKCLADVAGRTVLGRVLDRVRLVERLDGAIVATSALPRDDPIAEECARERVACFRGDEADVAGRVLEAARRNRFDVVLRVNADSPFALPALLSEALRRARAREAEYVTNIRPRTYPYGMSVEAFPAEALARAYRSMDARHREHVTMRFYEPPGDFRVLNLAAPSPLARPGVRLAVDTPEDLDRVRRLAEAVPSAAASYADLVAAIDRLGFGGPDGGARP